MLTINWGDTRLSARFWSKCVPEPNSGCWLWLASTSNGYGYFSVKLDGWINKRAHRFAYEVLVGEIAPGLHLDHLCRTPLCCNPAHLEPVTNRVNVLRGATIPARHAAATHCPRGHEYTPENTRHCPRGRGSTFRECRQCKRAANKRDQARYRAEARAALAARKGR